MDVDGPTPTSSTVEIVDLRGGDTPTSSQSSPFLSSPPVLHFFDSMAATVTQTQAKLAARQAQRSADQAKLQAVQRQLDEAKQRHDQETERLQAIHTLADKLAAVALATAKPTTNTPNSSNDQQATWLDVVHAACAFPAVFAPALASLAVTQLRPHLAGDQDWDPIADPTRCATQLALVRTATSAAASAHGGTYYDALIWTVWIPRVRAHLQSSSSWLTSLRDAQRVVDALATWTAVLSPAMHAHVVHQICVPRLRRALDTFSPLTAYPTSSSPSTSDQPVLGFLLPWFTQTDTLLPLPADSFFPGLAYKLCAVVDHVLVRHPRVPANHLSALPAACLASWHTVLGPAAWSTLVTRHLVPALTSHSRACIRIDPAAQDPGPLESLLAYLPLVGAPGVARALADGGALGAWTRVTHAWAQAVRRGDARAGELAAWWQVWRAYLPKDVWAKDATRGYLGAGLMVLRALAHGHEVPDPQVLVPKVEETAPHVKMSQTTYGQQQSRWQPTIKDLVTREVERQGLALEPLGKTLARVARPVYRVVAEEHGGARKVTRAVVYWDQDVVFVRRASGTVDENEDVVSWWDPVAIKDLVERCVSLSQ